MSFFDIADLPWLPKPPSDLRSAIRATGRTEPASLDRFQALASFALGLDECHALTSALKRSFAQVIAGRSDRLVRVAYINSFTTDFAIPAIICAGLRRGLVLDVYATPFARAITEVMDPDSGLHRHRPDIAVVSLDGRALGNLGSKLSEEEAIAASSAAQTKLTAVIERMRSVGARVVAETLPTPPEALLGHMDRAFTGSTRSSIERINRSLAAQAASGTINLIDIDALAAEIGLRRWFNARLWNEAKVPFDPEMCPIYGDHVARVIGAMRGRSAKALVLDLDNTLWQGVVGDDGVAGITVGPGTASGEAHVALQQYALDLKSRGIVLSVCSKNDEAVARAPFRDHDGMLMKEHDFAVFVANWNDKATNISQIARTLNIGLDAIVFLDDNPAERQRVRQILPDVLVPEVFDDASTFAATLSAAGYFEAIAISDDDLNRAEQYRQNAVRAIELESFGDMDSYLASLGMRASIRSFDELGRSRIAQLINKTNQFNLTTRRYTEDDVARMESDPSLCALQVRLVDRFGDNGMISTVIFRKRGAAWDCDTWLMSCRVLGRRLEEAVLDVIAGSARAAGAQRLTGHFIPTGRNGLVRDFWSLLGFHCTRTGADGSTDWELELASWSPRAVPIAVEAALDTRHDAHA